MTMPYSNPPSNLRSLQDRLVQAAQREGIVFGRLQRHVAVLVVTQLAAAIRTRTGRTRPPVWARYRSSTATNAPGAGTTPGRAVSYGPRRGGHAAGAASRVGYARRIYFGPFVSAESSGIGRPNSSHTGRLIHLMQNAHSDLWICGLGGPQSGY